MEKEKETDLSRNISHPIMVPCDEIPFALKYILSVNVLKSVGPLLVEDALDALGRRRQLKRGERILYL